MTTIERLDDLDGEPHATPFPGSEPKTVRLTLSAGERVAPHTHPGRDIVCYLVEGKIELQLGAETTEIAAGDIARFDGDQEISPHAVEDSTALLVLSQRPK